MTGAHSNDFPIILGLDQAGARGQHVTPELGHSLVDPQQGAVHGFQVIRAQQSLRPAELAVPAMDILVTQEAGDQLTAVGLFQDRLGRPVVAGLVMLLAERLDVIRKAQQPGVVPVVARCEHGACFRNQVSITLREIRRDFGRHARIGSNGNHVMNVSVWRRIRQVDVANELAHLHR